MVDPRPQKRVRDLPEPLSPSNRTRVPKLSPTYRSHNVQYEPGPHKLKVHASLDQR